MSVNVHLMSGYTLAYSCEANSLVRFQLAANEREIEVLVYACTSTISAELMTADTFSHRTEIHCDKCA